MWANCSYWVEKTNISKSFIAKGIAAGDDWIHLPQLQVTLYSLVFTVAFFVKASALQGMTKGPNETEEKQDCAAGLEEDPKDVDVICNITEAVLTEVGMLAGCPSACIIQFHKYLFHIAETFSP